MDPFEAVDRSRLPFELRDANIIYRGIYFWQIEKDGAFYQAEFYDDGDVDVSLDSAGTI